MNEHGGNNQPSSPDHNRDEQLAEISKTLTQISSQLTTLSNQVRALNLSVFEAPQPQIQQPQAPQPQAPQPQVQQPQAPQPQAQQSVTAPNPTWSAYWGDDPFGRQEDPFGTQRNAAEHAGEDPPATSVYPTLTERFGREGVGSKVLSWVGGAVTLFGVLLLMSLAIERGWIGPIPRILIAAALGVILIGLAVWLNLRPAAGQQDGPSAAEQHGPFALAATGFAILFIDIVATTAFLELIPAWTGVLIGLAIACAGLGLAYYWDSQRLAVFVLIAGAVCAAMLTEGYNAVLIAFLLTLLAATAPTELNRRWRGALLAAGAPPLLGSTFAILLYPLSTSQQSSELTVAIWAVIASAAVVAVVTLYALRHQTSDYAGLSLLIGVPVPPMLTGIIVDRWTSALLIAILGVALLGLWASRYFVQLPSAFAGLCGGVGVVLIFHATVAATDGDGRAFALLGQALLLGLLAGRLRLLGPLITSSIYGAVGLILAFAGPAPSEVLVDAKLITPSEETLAVAALAAALIMFTAQAIGYGAIRVLSDEPKWIAVSIMGVIVLYSTIGIVVSIALLASPDRTGFLTGHSVVTVLWAIIALVLLIRGIKRRPLRISGLILVAASLAKLILFDLASLDGLARVGAFLGAGLVLLTAGVRYARLVAATADQEEALPEHQE